MRPSSIRIKKARQQQTANGMMAARCNDRDFGTVPKAASVKCYIKFARPRKGPRRHYCSAFVRNWPIVPLACSQPPRKLLDEHRKRYPRLEQATTFANSYSIIRKS